MKEFLLVMFNMVIVFLKEFLLFKVHLEMFTDKIMMSEVCLRTTWKGDGVRRVGMKGSLVALP